MGFDENVLCVRKEITETWKSAAFTPCGDEAELLSEINQNKIFVNRGAAENDFTLHQIIPYVAIRCEHDWFVTKRTSKQTESRLHNMYSIGLGGHINPDESISSDTNIVEAGMYRELEEEIAWHSHYNKNVSLAGIISDDSTEVSKVHLGLLYIVSIDTKDIDIREHEKMTAEWMGIDRILTLGDSLESWSQIALSYIKNL